MNLLNFKTAKNFTRFAIFCFAFFAQVNVRAWEVDFSRRKKELKSMRLPASIVDEAQKKQDLTTNYFDAVEPTQEIVIMNTDKGFVPETIRLKKGNNYKIFVVNVNGSEKNASFILDAFSEHHATYFGQQKSFTLSPKADGIFSYQCPETAKQGKVIIFSDDSRKPASQ